MCYDTYTYLWCPSHLHIYMVNMVRTRSMLCDVRMCYRTCLSSGFYPTYTYVWCLSYLRIWCLSYVHVYMVCIVHTDMVPIVRTRIYGVYCTYRYGAYRTYTYVVVRTLRGTHLLVDAPTPVSVTITASSATTHQRGGWCSPLAYPQLVGQLCMRGRVHPVLNARTHARTWEGAGAGASTPFT
jgi:hypothetical protein